MSSSDVNLNATAAAADLVILVGPDDVVGTRIRDLLACWARAELLGCAYWLSPQDMSQGVVNASRIDGSGTTAVQLPDDLATTAFARCRVVLVQPVWPECPGDPALATFGHTYASFLERAVLPRPAATQVDPALLRLNLIIPTWDLTADGAESVTPDILVPGWEQTLVASPEERATPRQPNVLVRHETNLVTHAAVAVASVAGLWIGMSESPFAAFVDASDSGEPRPRLVRSFMRSVKGGEVTREVAHVALAPADGNWRVPSSDRPLAASPDPDGVIEDVVRDVGQIDHGALLYKPPPAALVSKKRKVGWRAVWAAFKEFWLVLFKRVADVPARLKEASERRITERLFGDEGAHQFHWSGVDSFERQVQLRELVTTQQESPDTTIFGQARLARRALALLGRRVQPEAAQAQTWVELRQLCLGMVDGSALPADLETPMTGAARQVITDPATLVPNSNDPRFEVPLDVIDLDALLNRYRREAIGPCDPVHTAQLDHDLDTVADRFEERAHGAEQTATQHAAEAATLRHSAAELPDQRESLLAQAASADAAAKRAQESQKAAQQRADRVREVEAELAEWMQSRSRTLLWQVGARIASELEPAVIDQQRALKVVADVAELDVNAIEKARKRTLRSMILWFVLAVALSTVGVFGAGVALAPIGGLALFSWLTWRSFRRYTRICSECEGRLERAVVAQQNGLNLLAHAAREVSRLSTTYRQYVEWAEMLGYQAHRPWTSPDENPEPPDPPGPQDPSGVNTPRRPSDPSRSTPRAQAQQPSQEVDETTLPASVAVGIATVEDETLAVLGSQVARDMQDEGWLLQAFHDASAFSMDRLARREGRRLDDLDPDTDASTSPTGAREFLLSDLRSQLPQHAAWRSAMAQIEEFCSKLTPETLFDDVHVNGRVERVTSFLAAIVPSTEEAEQTFPVDLLSASAQVRGGSEVRDSLAWAPTGVGDDTAVEHLPVSTTKSGQYLLQSVRIDVSRALQPTELTIFDASEPPAEARPPSAPSEDW